MNSYKTWNDTIARKPGCRIPRYDKYTPDLLKRVLKHTGCANGGELNKHFDTDPTGQVAIPRPADLPLNDYSGYYEGREIAEGATFSDVGTCRQPAGFFHFTGFVHPLVDAASLKDIEDYPLDDMVDWPTDGLKARVDQLHAQGYFVSGSVGHTYETAWQIRGYEEFLIDLMDRPAWAECLLERLTLRNIIKASATAKAGVDMLHTGDDVANQRSLMFPPDMWRSIFKPRLARVIAAGRAHNPDLQIWYHSDGNIMQIIPDLIEIGVTVLNPVQPECMDPVEIYEKFGDRLVLDGTIGTQTVMPFGTTADVEKTVRTTIEKCGQAGGLVLSPTHVLEPEVPIDNIVALFDACAKYGNGS